MHVAPSTYHGKIATIHDALVALTAKIAGAALATADRRAIPVYELVGVELGLLDVGIGGTK